MAKHIISVCIFCLLCATHSPCESHTTVNRLQLNHLHNSHDDPALRIRRDIEAGGGINRNSNMNGSDINSQVKTNSIEHSNSDTKSDLNNNLAEIETDIYLQRLFEKYGDGSVITKKDFVKLLKDLQRKPAVHSTENTTNQTAGCQAASLIESSKSTLVDANAFKKLCPLLVFAAVDDCKHVEVLEQPHSTAHNFAMSVWLYSTLSVVIISACGILALAVIPIMQTHYYQQMLQFLVALAVSTLAGDAFLHLLPHSMSSERHSHEDSDHSEGNHEDNMWKGFVAMSGLIFFFIIEKFIVVIAKWRKAHQMKQKPPKVKVMKTEALQPASTGEKQCKHKYSSIPYCYNAIAMIDNNQKSEECPGFRLLGGQDSIESHNETALTTLNELGSDSDMDSFKKSHSASSKLETNQNIALYKDSNSPEAPNSAPDTKESRNSVEYTVILREHENRHHGHSHTHGHVHAAPKSMSSVAWMVIMGDGVHNFTDGMAIGAAFSNGIAGGFSTSVAVFCHELPHELGDFAMLLKAGMTVKQALFYNVLSSILCLLGNVVGVYLGMGESGSTWLFAIAAGMFVYIALVDMMPELSSGHDDDGTLLQHLLQVGGLLLGFAIMTLIAMYEHDLKHIFLEPI